MKSLLVPICALWLCSLTQAQDDSLALLPGAQWQVGTQASDAIVLSAAVYYSHAIWTAAAPHYRACTEEEIRLIHADVKDVPSCSSFARVGGRDILSGWDVDEDIEPPQLDFAEEFIVWEEAAEIVRAHWGDDYVVDLK